MSNKAKKQSTYWLNESEPWDEEEENYLLEVIKSDNESCISDLKRIQHDLGRPKLQLFQKLRQLAWKLKQENKQSDEEIANIVKLPVSSLKLLFKLKEDEQLLEKQFHEEMKEDRFALCTKSEEKIFSYLAKCFDKFKERLSVHIENDTTRLIKKIVKEQLDERFQKMLNKLEKDSKESKESQDKLRVSKRLAGKKRIDPTILLTELGLSDVSTDDENDRNYCPDDSQFNSDDETEISSSASESVAIDFDCEANEESQPNKKRKIASIL